MATVYTNYNKNGKIISYKFQCCLGRDKNGKQIIRTKTVKPPSNLTPAKAKAKMENEAYLWEEDLRAMNAGDENMTFGFYVEKIFFPIHVDGKGDNDMSPTTKDFYHFMSSKAINYFGKKKLSKITTLDIDDFITQLRQTPKKNGDYYKPKTLKHYLRTLNTMFSFAKDKGLIKNNPVEKAEKISVPKSAVNYYNAEEALSLIEYVDAHYEMRYRCIIRFLIYYGLRRGELCGLQWRDIDFNEKSFSIAKDVTYSLSAGKQVGKTKTDSSVRVLPLNEELIELLRLWQQNQIEIFSPAIIEPTSFVFSSKLDMNLPLSPDAITDWVKRTVANMGLRDMSPHDLRHTCATLMSKSGAQAKTIQSTLGHSDIKTTLTYYIGTDIDMVREESNNYINTFFSKKD